MKRRCKDSLFKKMNLRIKLTFRSKYRAADIEKIKILNSGLFEISKSDEKKLDVYEIVKLYIKTLFLLLWKKL